MSGCRALTGFSPYLNNQPDVTGQLHSSISNAHSSASTPTRHVTDRQYLFEVQT